MSANKWSDVKFVDVKFTGVEWTDISAFGPLRTSMDFKTPYPYVSSKVFLNVPYEHSWYAKIFAGTIPAHYI